MHLYVEGREEQDIKAILKTINSCLDVTEFILHKNDSVDTVDFDGCEFEDINENALFRKRLFKSSLKSREVDDFNPYEASTYSSNVAGVQSKFVVEGTGDFVKIDKGRKEGLRESVAYLFSTCIDEIFVPEYKTIVVQDIHTGEVYTGCISKNIKSYCKEDFVCLSEHVNDKYKLLSREEKLSKVSQYVDIKSLFQLLAFDLIIGNRDRHLGNIAVYKYKQGLYPYQYDNGFAFYALEDVNIMEESENMLLRQLILNPFEITVMGFLKQFKDLNIDMLHIDIAKYKNLKDNARCLFYSPAYMHKLFNIIDYNLGQTKNIIWTEKRR